MVRLFLFIFLFIATQCEDELTVTTTSGILKGKRDIILGHPMKLYLGVPYAKPPVGELRFKPPVSFESEGVERNAQSFAASCYQPPHAAEVINPLLKPNQFKVSEDCLYLNIYVPDGEHSERLPVMIWLAGEGFNYADPSQFDGSYLSTEGKVIVVTVNYRLSVFGFLSALHHDAPGNVGLLDQRSAMKWVQRNIANFNGDASRVTLFGRFTGAMSAAIHAFSPLSKEEVLFQRVILMSGVPDGDWVFDLNPLNATFALAQATDCVYSTMAESIACFKRLPADVLLKFALPIPDAWRPMFDFNVIYEHTLKAAKKGNYNPVDIMIGLNKDEGSLCLTALKAMKSEYFERILKDSLKLEDFKQLIENHMMDVYKEKNDFVNKLVAFQYTKSNGSSLRNNYVEFCGDLHINAHSEKLANVVSSQNQTVYMYELSHRPKFSIQPSFIEAGHGDDVLYALGLPLSLKSLPEEEDSLTKRMVKTFASFAKYGRPLHFNGSQWPAYTPESRLLMRFDTVKIDNNIHTSTHEEAVKFWHDIIPAARKRNPPQPHHEALLDIPEHRQDNAEHAFFLGTWVTIPTAEFIMLGLVCISGLLLVTSFIAVVVMFRIKHHATFRRLK